MHSRDFGLTTLGRFLAVECYRESHQPPSTHSLRTSAADRTAGNAGKPDSGNAGGGSPTPARPQHS
jgi:hypothetical protein